MKKEELQKLISQIKKYDLTKVFDTTEEFDKWLSKLNEKQIKNFNSLEIEPSLIMFPIRLLINEDLLNCDDYTKRITAMSKLKNGKGCWHLFDRLCSPNFLNSKNYYQDIEMISKADTARYALWIINEDSFINSPYHNEDLKLIVETHDTSQENPLDFVVSDALATVAGNIDSIKSPYHQKDMQLIATSGSDCLQMSHTYPEHSLNNLAINKVSLSDKYHLENMQILATNPIASKYLYYLMSDPNIVKGKYYRKEIEVLLNATSEINAMAIYHHITNPVDIDRIDFYDTLRDCELDVYDIGIICRNNNIKGSMNPNYIENLALLNKIEERFVIYIEHILSNKELFNSKYQTHDINLILSIKDKDIFMDLYRLMTNDISLSGKHHIKDTELISKTQDKRIRKLLLGKATNKNSVNSNNHEYDMQYIAKLDWGNIEEEIYKKIYYYLFNTNGINHIEHIKRLEKLYNGEMIEKEDDILEHLTTLENNPTLLNIQKPKSSSNNKLKVLARIKNILKK